MNENKEIFAIGLREEDPRAFFSAQDHEEACLSRLLLRRAFLLCVPFQPDHPLYGLPSGSGWAWHSLWKLLTTQPGSGHPNDLALVARHSVLWPRSELALVNLVTYVHEDVSWKGRRTAFEGPCHAEQQARPSVEYGGRPLVCVPRREHLCHYKQAESVFDLLYWRKRKS